MLPPDGVLLSEGLTASAACRFSVIFFVGLLAGRKRKNEHRRKDYCNNLLHLFHSFGALLHILYNCYTNPSIDKK